MPFLCALLSDRNTCFVVDCASSRRKAIGRVNAMTFTTRSKDFELTKEDVVKDGGTETETSTYSWAEILVFGHHFNIPLDRLRRKFLVCGGRPRAFNDNKWVDKMRNAVQLMPATLLQTLGDFGGTAKGKDGGFEGPSSLVTADPDPEAQKVDILTNTTRCQAASPTAVAFLAAAWVNHLDDAVRVANDKVAGHIFELYQRLQFVVGGRMRVLKLGPDPARETSLWLPPAKIIMSKDGHGQNEDFFRKMEDLPTTLELDTALATTSEVFANMTVKYAEAEVLRFIQLIPVDQRHLLLPRYESDFHQFLEPLDKAVDSALPLTMPMPRTLVVAESLKNTVPNMDAADCRNRVFSMKSGAFSNGALNGTQLETYLRHFDLDRPGRDRAGKPAQRLQYYWTVPTVEFDKICGKPDEGILNPADRRPIKWSKNAPRKKTAAETADLQDCFDEWLLCTPSLSLEYVVTVANKLFKDEPSPSSS
jgi:hypothetical protein